jgi:copper(I)-binding protein
VTEALEAVVTGSSRRNLAARSMLAAAVAAIAPLATACEAGNNAPTTQYHWQSDGTNGIQGAIRIINVFVLGPPPSQTLAAGQSAGLFLALANTGATPDALVGISAPGTAASVRLPGGSVQLPPQQLVRLNGPAPVVLLQHLDHALSGGSAVNLILTFRDAGTKGDFKVPVMPRAEYYATLSPAAAASPRATPSGRHPQHSNAGSPSASPSSSP